MRTVESLEKEISYLKERISDQDDMLDRAVEIIKDLRKAVIDLKQENIKLKSRLYKIMRR